MGIRDLRKNRKMTQDELSNLTGISRKTINRVENGRKKDLRLSSFVFLASAFNMNLDSFYKEYLDSKPFNGGFLRKIRNDKGLTQKELRAEIGVGKNTILKIEKYGINNCFDSTKLKVADYLGVSVNELVKMDY